MEEKYERIISLPHHTSPIRKRMEMKDRAAQFAPYAALVGFGDVVDETARVTERRIFTDESEKERLDRILTQLAYDGKGTEAEITYFEKDERKDGGRYVSRICGVEKLDEYTGTVTLSDKTKIKIEDIVSIETV